MKGTIAQKSEPRNTTCKAGANVESSLVKFGRNAKKKRSNRKNVKKPSKRNASKSKSVFARKKKKPSVENAKHI